MLSYSLSYSTRQTLAHQRRTRDERPVSPQDNRPLSWVGVAGFEPAASSSRTKRAAKLRYTPPPAYVVTKP